VPHGVRIAGRIIPVRRLIVQKKIIIDTSIYIDIFNSGLRKNLRNPFRYVVMLAYPVLYELWMGARGKNEVDHLVSFQNEFVKLKRLITPI
jgi:hypothetical protein